MFPLDGSGFRPIEGLQLGFTPVGWTPDGASLYVMQFSGDRRRRKLFRMNLATGKMDLWKTLGEGINSGVTSVGGAMFAKDANAYAYIWVQTLSQAYLVRGLK